MTVDGRRATIGVVAVIAAHLLVSLLWLSMDSSLPDGDELGVLGAVELFWGQTHREGAFAALVSGLTEDFGEYPALHYIVTGVATAWAGVTNLDGDGPARVGLLWGMLALAGVAILGWQVAEERRGAAAIWSAALLASSPLWSSLQRHLLLENALCAGLAGTAAALFAAHRHERWGLWVLSGVGGALCLLTKQTSVLALLPLGAVLLGARWRSAGLRATRGPLLAAGVAALLAGPWYLRRLGTEGAYLMGSAGANPDAVGPLHQLAFYPLALAQQAWTPVVWVFVGAVVWTRRDRLHPVLVAAFLVGLTVLVGIPKKYPRLLLGLLPLGAATLGAAASQWTGAQRAVLGVALAVSVGVTGFVSPSPPVVAASSLGLTGVDERCFQRWTAPPTAPGLPWDELIAAVRAHVGDTNPEVDEDDLPRLGAIAWPAPPCAHQTSHDLGEHLRIRLRRAHVGVAVDAGGAFVQRDGWPEGPPDFLLSDGALACGEPPGAAGAGDPCAAAHWDEVARIPYAHPTWSLDLRLWRRAE